MHDLFGRCYLVTCIKSEGGDYNAGKALVENYGVKWIKMHTEVLLERNKISFSSLIAVL
jgi:dipeptidyl-peptidase-3